MDRVFIDGLRVEAVIGIHPWERHVRQPLSLDLEVATDAARVARTDDIATAVDYSALAERLTGFIQEGRFRLLETLAEEAAAMIMREFGASWLRLRVAKPGAVAAADAVGVEIERGEP